MYPGRTTSTLVGGIISLDPSIDVSPFIDAANELVTEKCAGLLAVDGLTLFYQPNRLELIERWLSAHFYAASIDLQGEDEQIGPIRERYMGQTKVGLMSTYWGQQALRIDTSGVLAMMDNADNKYSTPPPALFANIHPGVWALAQNCPRRSLPE